MARGLASTPITERPSSRAARKSPSCGNPQPTMSTRFADFAVSAIGALALQSARDIAVRTDCLVGGFRETDFLGDVVKRATLDLDENAPDVFADDRQRNELQPAEDDHRGKEARVPHR